MNPLSYGLDTSVLVRLLTRDPLSEFRAAAALVDEWREGTPRLAVSDLVLAEAYYALQYHYSMPKAAALEALEAIARHPAIAISAHARGILSLPGLATAKPGFVDRLIHGHAQAAGATLVTFEKSARTLPATRVLEG